MQRVYARHAIAAVVLFACVTWCIPAWGAWLAPVESGQVLLAYGAAHPGGTHRGVDLAADAGALVSSPADGTVAFVGNVPADGGGTCGAVTIETADGLRLSLLPFDSVSLSEGARVTAGETVGALAATGDGSVSTPHLHLSVRRGETYLDPSGFLPRTTSAPSPGEIPPASAAAPSSGSGSGSSSPVGGIAPTAAAPAPSGVGAVGPVRVADPGPTVAPPARSVSRAVIVDAGVPEPSSLRPELTFKRDTVSVGPVAPSAQTLIAGALGLALIATAVAIVRPQVAAARAR